MTTVTSCNHDRLKHFHNSNVIKDYIHYKLINDVNPLRWNIERFPLFFREMYEEQRRLTHSRKIHAELLAQQIYFSECGMLNKLSDYGQNLMTNNSNQCEKDPWIFLLLIGSKLVEIIRENGNKEKFVNRISEILSYCIDSHLQQCKSNGSYDQLGITLALLGLIFIGIILFLRE